MNPEPLSSLEERLAYGFRQPALLAEALRHSSLVNEQPESDPALKDNQRLEFLGDAVLNLVVSDLLMARFPAWREGELSRMRAQLVNETQLAAIARQLKIGPHLQLGKGELQNNGREKNSILADALEAVIAAVYLDGGFAPASTLVRGFFSALLQSPAEDPLSGDFKSRLQEMTQQHQKITPVYEVIAERGPDHDKTFIARVTIGAFQATGGGKSKKSAEQAAARNALDQLGEPS
jgi:ribonuclease III